MPELKVNGRRIAYRVAGSGPLVIMLHCSSSHSGQWKPYIDALQDRFRVAAPDLHGYGRSDPLPTGDGPWFAHDALIPEALAAAEGAEQAHLVGHSLGGATAFFAARSNPERYLSLTMIEPVLFALLDEMGDPLKSDCAGILSVFDRMMSAGDSLGTATHFVDFWSGPGTWSQMPDEVRAYVKATIGRVHDDWRGCDPGAPGQARIEDCKRLALPVQLHRGECSRPSARAISGHLAREIASARLTEVPRADHMAAVFEPEKFVAPIAAFLDGTTGNGAGAPGKEADVQGTGG